MLAIYHVQGRLNSEIKFDCYGNKRSFCFHYDVCLKIVMSTKSSCLNFVFCLVFVACPDQHFTSYSYPCLVV